MIKNLQKITFFIMLNLLYLLNILHSENLNNMISSCEKKESSACRKIAVANINNKNLLDDLSIIENILNLYHKACDNGDNLACLHLSILYYNNVETKFNRKKMLNLYKKVPMIKKSLIVFNNLGYHYTKGDAIVAKDYKKAFELFKYVCENNIGEGCYNLGVMYHNGKYIEKDYYKALNLFKKSCGLGYKQSCSLVH